MARKEQAAANAREVARLLDITRQEKTQEARLVAIRQRQAIQQAVAEVQARAVARRLAQAQATEAKRAEAKAVVAVVPDIAAEIPVESASKADKEAHKERVAKKIAETVTDKGADTYTVRKGDYLTKLARERSLSVAQLMAWNELDSEVVVPGQRLLLHAPVVAGEVAKSFRKQSKKEAKTVAVRPRPVQDKRLETPKVHLVQSGDTLFNLSRRFGVSVQVLRELNHLTSDEVKLGQKLLVPQG